MYGKFRWKSVMWLEVGNLMLILILLFVYKNLFNYSLLGMILRFIKKKFFFKIKGVEM